LQACSAAPVLQLPVQRQPLSKGQTLFVDIDDGSLDISSQGSVVVEISGQAPRGQTVLVTTGTDGVHITSKAEKHPFWQTGTSLLHLNLRVPNGTSVTVNSFDAGMVIHDFSGNLSVSAASGDISLRHSDGNFAIMSNRGNVSVEGTTGAVHLAGNYGLLAMTNTHGTSAAATIMGTVRYEGTISAGDQVSLETDHGPVEIQLGSASNVTVKAGTTSGVVTCTIPGLHYDGQGCAGTLQAGKGQLNVRTVSGNATLVQLP
jgi:DUF4097 and DUF4098 domain-containing protein YvlB